jgi:Ca2+-binding EF-hand superfamily protein
LNIFDSYDVNSDGFLDASEMSAMAADLGLNLDFLIKYINCLFVDELLDEDELLKAVCVGGKYIWVGVFFI